MSALLGEGKPGGEVLVGTLLVSKAVADKDNWALGKEIANEGGEEGLGCDGNAGAGQDAPLLQAPREGLHGGSFQDRSE